MDLPNKTPLSDDEEDLEALRLAALQSLKKPSDSTLNNDINRRPYFKSRNSPSERGRPHPGYAANKGKRNGQFHGNRSNSNLIALTPTEAPEQIKLKNEKGSTFIRPQDKYTKESQKSEIKSDEITTKFDRYRDSDKSDDEDDSEDELLKPDSDDDSPTKLERSDSLEALMQELDDEIQGKSKIVKEKSKDKPKKPSVKVEEDEEKDSKEEILLPEKVEDSISIEIEPEEKSMEMEDKAKSPQAAEQKSPEQRQKRKRISPPVQKTFNNNYRGRARKFNYSVPQQQFVRPPYMPVTNSSVFPPNAFVFPFLPPSLNVAPHFYARPLSPLRIDAETLQTQTMAPLSPRSAAFVLENRAIIEKRKRSPRRSFSRSPSTSPRSLSPRRRSGSPPMRKRSLTPIRKRLSPSRRRTRSPSPLKKKRSRSPKRRSLSPKQRSPSPKRRNFSPKRRSASPKRRSLSPRRKPDRKDIENGSKNKPSIRERLGFKTDKEVKTEESSPKNDKPLDPILEARKRKFESKEIKVREGVIRLKPKEEIKADSEKPEIVQNEPKKEAPNQPEKVDENPLEEDELDLEAAVDLFSDEDLLDEAEKHYKNDPKSENETKNEIQQQSRKIRKRTENKLRKSKPSNNKLGVKADRPLKKFERKIEIKIKDPAKYEEAARKGGSSKNREENEEDDTEIIIENDEDETENDTNKEGDLRAQLSKKRADKMHKTLKPREGISSRLLQNALENALPIKKLKKSKTKELTSNDAKLPIHLRLGQVSEIEPKKKSKKRKNNNKTDSHQV